MTSIKSVLAGFIFLLSPIQEAVALAASCDDLGGSIVLRDTIYGGLTGALLTGLGLLAVGNSEYADRRFAAGSLLGAGLGTTFGVVETFYRPGCRPQEAASRDRARSHSAITFAPFAVTTASKTVGLRASLTL